MTKLNVKRKSWLIFGLLVMISIMAQPSLSAADKAPLGEIAFVSDRDGNDEIYITNADGSNQRNLTNNPAEDEYPNWSPDGQRIAFLSARDNGRKRDEGPFHLYLMDADGKNVTQLSDSLVAWADFFGARGNPLSWSPDGGKIAFAASCSNNDGCWTPDIYTIDVTSGETSKISSNGGDRPVWSLDGQFIAFASGPEAPFPYGHVAFNIVNINDGSWFKLAYDGLSLRGDEPYQLGIDEQVIDEANETVLYTIGIYDVHDAKKAVRLDTEFIFKRDQNLAFLNVRNIKTDQPVSNLRSPDNQWEVFTSDSDENFEIYIQKVDDNKQVYRLTNNEYLDANPVWRPYPANPQDS